MLFPLFPLVLVSTTPLQVPLRLSAASIGRREYGVEITTEANGEVSSTETAVVAERISAKGTGFLRSRYVVGALFDGEMGTFPVGRHERMQLAANGTITTSDRSSIPLPDVQLPEGPLASGSEWDSRFFGNDRIRCRYEGDVTIAGRTAARVALLRLEKPEGIHLEESYVLFDRSDALLLQTYIHARIDSPPGQPERVGYYRLRRTNVKGLGLPPIL